MFTLVHHRHHYHQRFRPMFDVNKKKKEKNYSTKLPVNTISCFEIKFFFYLKKISFQAPLMGYV